jgi:acyl carrier protein
MTELAEPLRVFVLDALQQRADVLGVGDLEVDGSFDFFESGLLDSLGLITLIDSIETEFQLEVDLTEMDPEAFTTVDGLVAALIAGGQ